MSSGAAERRSDREHYGLGRYVQPVTSRHKALVAVCCWLPVPLLLLSLVVRSERLHAVAGTLASTGERACDGCYTEPLALLNERDI